MVSTVQSRPNHYQTLGLEVGASIEEIARAFAAKMSGIRPRPMSVTAQICAAYETLRNPDKRRAYDDALGLKPKPARLQWTVTAARWNGMPFATPAPANATLVAPVATRPSPEPRAQPFIAAAPSEAISTETQSRARELLRRLEEQRRPQPQPELRAEPPARPEPRVDAPVNVDQLFFRAVEERPNDEETPQRRLNRTAMIVGSVFVGVGLVGAWAGIVAGGNAQSANTVTLDLPRPKAVAAPVIAAADAAPSVVDAQREPRRLSPVADRRMVRSPARVPQDRQAEPALSEPSQPDALAAEPAVAEPTPIAATMAKMPLPNSVIARTIGRIGYACGEVASTTAVEGQAGVFDVTCTSGSSYRAAPVHGRYRFRRMGRR